MSELYFSESNAKLRDTVIFSIPAGHTCPFAMKCKSMADRVTGRVTDGPETEWRCFSASSEARSPALRKHLWENYEALVDAYDKGGTQAVADLIIANLPTNVPLVRIHVSGDFFSEQYFEAWCRVARAFPGKVVYREGQPYPEGTIFYAYTKALHLMLRDDIPENLVLTASRGGRLDRLIDKHELKEARVVFSQAEADELGYEIDHDDSLAWSQDKNFALLLHGTQPKGSDASQALKKLKKAGWTGYNSKGKKS